MASYRKQFAEKLANDLERHPSDRSGGLGHGWGRLTLEQAAGGQINALETEPMTPDRQVMLDRLLSALMMPDYMKPTQFQIRQRKKWDGMARQAGHPLGSCFDEGEYLCGVCSK